MNNTLPTIEAIPFISQENEDLDVHIDGINILQQYSNRPCDVVSFVSNTMTDDTVLIKNIISM